MIKRLAAICSLGLAAAALGLAAVTAVREFPRGVAVLGLIVLALGCGWFALVRRGIPRAAGLAAVALSAAAVVLLLVADSH